MDKRKQLAATLGLFASLFVAVGAVAATGPATTAIRVFVVVAIVVALLLALMAWGVVQSVRLERHEADLDAVIEQAVAASPGGFGQLCDCGHQHDPTELHITDAEPEPAPADVAYASASASSSASASADACAHDGHGATCTHSCETCVLSSLRPSPNQTRAERLPH